MNTAAAARTGRRLSPSPGRSNPAAVIRPMQQRLPLSWPANYVAGFAISLNLQHMPADGLPASDLPRVLFGGTSPEIVPAIPLEPAARIVAMDPSFLAPHRQWLAGVDTKVIETAITSAGCELGAGKPATREFGLAVRQVFTAKHAKTKHFSRRQLRPEFGIEVPPARLGKSVTIAALHFVVDDDCSFAHRTTSGLPHSTTNRHRPSWFHNARLAIERASGAEKIA